MGLYKDLVLQCDRLPYDKVEEVYYLYLPRDTRPHGIMRPHIVAKMPWTSDFDVNHAEKKIQLRDPHEDVDLTTYTNEAFASPVNKAIDGDLFEILHKRHSEPYRIMGANYPCQIERFSHSLFGIVARGAHMTAYCQTSEGLKIWVPRRAKHLFTYPGKLDSTVAGGVKASDDPVDCILAESLEEASLSEDLVKQRLKSAGTLTYVTTYTPPSGLEPYLISPEVLYVYDLELPLHVELKPNDDEVEEFYLLSVEEVKVALEAREFKTNSAVVMIDFFIRHGVITQENEPDYVDILSRIHRRLPVAFCPSS